ncbi:MAG: carbohydrate ABC transporter permease [Spirochaetales bacterium]|nr:carbohydrate ABC transporter permease [Spirochaetales bacterium]
MKNRIEKTILYLLMIILAVISIGPFSWLISTALKGQGENLFLYPPRLIPEDFTLVNFARVFDSIPFLTYMSNSAIVAVFSVSLNLLISAMAAYPLARMRFKGKKPIFFAILSTMMIPFQVTMIPIFIIITRLGLKNNYLGLVLPTAVTAFGIFLIRQAFLAIPDSLEEATLIDGGGSWLVFTKILLPLSKPTLAALAIFSFINSWGNFLWPLLILDSKEMFTLPLGLQDLQGTFTNDWRLIASGTVLSVIPVLIFFLFTQKYFVQGVSSSGIKE